MKWKLSDFTTVLWCISEWNSLLSKKIKHRPGFYPLVVDWIVKSEHCIPEWRQMWMRSHFDYRLQSEKYIINKCMDETFAISLVTCIEKINRVMKTGRLWRQTSKCWSMSYYHCVFEKCTFNLRLLQGHWTYSKVYFKLQ